MHPFQNFLAVLPQPRPPPLPPTPSPHPIQSWNSEKKSGYTRPTLFVGSGEGLDPCVNWKKPQKCTVSQDLWPGLWQNLQLFEFLWHPMCPKIPLATKIEINHEGFDDNVWNNFASVLVVQVALQRIQLIKASESVHVAGKWATETLFSALPQREKVLDIIKIWTDYLEIQTVRCWGCLHSCMHGKHLN